MTVGEEPDPPGAAELDEGTVLLYRWALEHRGLTADALPRAAADTGLDEPGCQRAVRTLTRAGLLQELPAPDPGDPRARAWRAVSPQTAAARVLADRDSELRAREDALRQQRTRLQREHDALAALVPVYLRARQAVCPESTIDHLADQDAVRSLLNEVIDSCTSEIIVSKHGRAFPPNALREALPRDLALLARGVRMRCLYQHATRYDLPTRTHAEQLLAAGAQIRTMPEVVPQMILVDRAMALLPAATSGALVIREPDLVAYLIRVFERDWENATVFGTGPRAAHEISGTIKRSILVLLAKGLKDDAVARRLGISLRTCRRHVSEILEGLGAQSRFEAGAIAEREGLTVHADGGASGPVGGEPAGPPAQDRPRCPACTTSLPTDG
ncbi:LuxR C-terminal-related transcriptional regulator [Streptomyces sp. NPDC000594]|uniref:helix-turn-helix transcriptional regulator n=1 Tax=Streptomyces sp. NPDC000594 TaxID=3154261 RepID=UPI00332DE5B6